MKTFNVLSLATANDRLALDLEQVISTIDKIESFYSTVAENGVSDVAVDVHLSTQEVIPEVLADVERVCKEDSFLNAFRKMYFFITNYSLEELYEMDATAEIKMKPEFAFKDPLQPGETPRLLDGELPAPPEEVVVPEDVLKYKSFDGGVIPPGDRKHVYDSGKLAEAIEANLAQRKAVKAKRPRDVTMRVYVQGIVEKHLPGGGVVREYSTTTVSPRVIHWLEGDTFMVGGVTFTQTVLSFQTDMGENALEARINDYKRILDKKDPSLCIYFEAQLKRLSVANRVNADFVVNVAKLAYGLLDGSVTPTNSMGY